MPKRVGKALAYAIVIWIVGFVWGSVVFMTPALKSLRPIPYVSSNPAISFPILILWLPLGYLLSRSYLKGASEKQGEGIRLGLVFSLINLLLDVVVLVLLLKAGFAYFVSLTVWLGYLLLFIIPWLTSRSMHANSKTR